MDIKISICSNCRRVDRMIEKYAKQMDVDGIF